MRIAFYAPLKPPTAAAPSGDRQMARQLEAALRRAGHGVELASIFRSRDGAGDARRQQRIAEIGHRLAGRIIRRYAARSGASRPGAWFTYHLYHKAPDWIGPRVSAALGIPYIVAEASFAPKQKGGKWAAGHEAAAAAIRAADAVISLNSRDSACVLPLLDNPSRLHALRPFTDIAPFALAGAQRADHRKSLEHRLAIAAGEPLLLVVAMMRYGDKLESYRVLGDALTRLLDLPWRLIVVGDGPARTEVARALAPLGPDRSHFVGEVSGEALPSFYAAADILVWPAISEAYGMALVEAQATGLPIVAGDAGGVGDIVRDGITGLLTVEGDPVAFADAVRLLLEDPKRRTRCAQRALRTAANDHSLDAAAARLGETIANLAGVPAR